ncbi:sigma-70 family RNA polymerase sigma factor, partial [Ruminococcus sp.]
MSESLKNLSELSDAKLAELVKSGNDSAFDVLTLRYLRNIGFLAKKYSADGYERNDFVQEGLLGLLYACRTFDSNNKASFKSYVDIVAERRFISIVRKAQRQKAVPSSSLVSLDADNDELEGESTDPEQLMLAKEHYSLLLDELKTLL